MIDLSTREVPAPLATGNAILLDSDGKIRMQYVVSDPDPDVGDGTQGTMAVILTASETAGFVALGFPDESGGMVGAQAVVGTPQYNMIVKYDLKGYADQAALLDEQQTLMDASVEAVDGDIVLKLRKFLVEEGGNDIIVDGSWYPGRPGMEIIDSLGCWC